MVACGRARALARHRGDDRRSLWAGVAQTYTSNAGLNYRFDAGARAHLGSEKELEIEWFMNQEFRLALLRNWQKDSPWMAIDFTRYDLPAAEPKGLQREWSLMNVLNQKGLRPQDKPKRLSALSAEDQRLIFTRYAALKQQA